MRHGRRDAAPQDGRARDGGSVVTGLLVGVALLLSGATGYVVGSATGAPEAAAAPMVSEPSPSATPTTMAMPVIDDTSTTLPAQDDTAMSMSANGAMSAGASAGADSIAGGQSGRSDANLASDDVEVLNWVETDDPVFFITIDDGLEQSQEVLDFVRANEIPVTAFLTEYAVRDHTDYFEAVTAYGGSIQNHSMVHGAFDSKKTDVRWEICETQDRYEKQFGTRPWMLRPPYGNAASDPSVAQIAQECGINRIVLWNVLVTPDNEIEYWDAPLRAGDIVLFHFTEGLEVGLEKILELGRQQGLTPAPLEEYI